MTITKRKVTPQIAAEWLAKNTHNRAIKKTVVDFYAQQMRDEEWLEDSGETIKFEGNFERLLDGQHRLHAIIKSGVTVDIWVAVFCQPDAFKVIDTGARRKGSDIVSIEGYKYPMRVAAIVKCTNTLFKSPTFASLGWIVGNGNSGTTKISNTQLSELLCQLDQACPIEEIARVTETLYDRTVRTIRAAHLGAAVYFFGQVEGYDFVLRLMESINDKNHWVQYLMKAKLQKQYHTASEYGKIIYYLLSDAKHGVVRSRISKSLFSKEKLPTNL